MQLDPVIQQQIATSFGHELRYPSDFDALAMDISERTGQAVSTNTLKRLFGLIGPDVEPRHSTLDTLARYLGAGDWSLCLAHLSETGNSGFGEDGQAVETGSLAPGMRVTFAYPPGRRVEMEHLGEGRFRILSSEHSKLLAGDIMHTASLCLHYPLIADSVVRDGAELGRFVAGQTGGLTELTIR